VNARAAGGPADAHAVAHVFVAGLDDRCEIAGDDGHHLQRVRRLAPGEIVTAADDSGAWRSYVVTEVATGRLTLEARGDAQLEPEPVVGVALAVALTKGGLDDVIAAVTELGVARITPLRTARSVVRWDEDRARRGVGRLRVVAREAAMQSRRARIPVVDEVAGLADVAARPGLVVADRNGVSAAELPAPAAGWTVLVGPEGGLSSEELAGLAPAPRLALGPHVLRAATAPVAAVAVLVAAATQLGSE